MDHAVSVKDFVIFISIFGMTIILMAKLPGLARKIFLKHLARRFRREGKLRGWDLEDKKKSLEYNKQLIVYFTNILF